MPPLHRALLAAAALPLAAKVVLAQPPTGSPSWSAGWTAPPTGSPSWPDGWTAPPTEPATPRPTSRPTVSAAPTTACFPQWVGGLAYGIGTRVSAMTENGRYNFLCVNYLCSEGVYDPTGPYGGIAWEPEAAPCDGTIIDDTITQPLAACPPRFSAGADYGSGDAVSVCDPSSPYCQIYTCKIGNDLPAPSAWCPMPGYEPLTGLYWAQAWDLGPLCVGDAVAPTPVVVDQPVQGCPPRFSAGADYGSGDAVSVCHPGEDCCQIYTCKIGNDLPAPSAWCPMPGYEAGTGLYWEQAWDEGGCCVGDVIAPTPTEAFTMGCPAQFTAGGDYGSGDLVSVCENGPDAPCTVYRCKIGNDLPAPSAWCPMPGYEPGTSLYWAQAWDEMGSCTGTMDPAAPEAAMDFLGGCPAAYDPTVFYGTGDRVSAGGFVFECKEWPYDGWCSQAGYEPLVDLPAAGIWADAWTTIGWCSGTISDEEVLAQLEQSNLNLGQCPPTYETGGDYGAGDMVTVCDESDRWCTVYSCMEDLPAPSRWCPLPGYEPGTGMAWDLAWVEEGFCDATITTGPTSSPTFDQLDLQDGCPYEWDASTIYDEGQCISYVASTAPERKLKFCCRGWPYTGWCSLEGYRPGTDLAHMAWELTGACEGTYAPTTAEPSKAPTETPTWSPSISWAPSRSPTAKPTPPPTPSPTKAPTWAPSTSWAPSRSPTGKPTPAPVQPTFSPNWTAPPTTWSPSWVQQVAPAPSPCPGGCPSGHFCMIEGVGCGGDGAASSCEPIPAACPQNYYPVCGCDGITYGNGCMAHAAGTNDAALGVCSP